MSLSDLLRNCKECPENAASSQLLTHCYAFAPSPSLQVNHPRHHASKQFKLIVFDLVPVLITRLIIVDLTAIHVQMANYLYCICKSLRVEDAGFALFVQNFIVRCPSAILRD